MKSGSDILKQSTAQVAKSKLKHIQIRQELTYFSDLKIADNENQIKESKLSSQLLTIDNKAMLKDIIEYISWCKISHDTSKKLGRLLRATSKVLKLNKKYFKLQLEPDKEVSSKMRIKNEKEDESKDEIISSLVTIYQQSLDEAKQLNFSLSEIRKKEKDSIESQILLIFVSILHSTIEADNDDTSISKFSIEDEKLTKYIKASYLYFDFFSLLTESKGLDFKTSPKLQAFESIIILSKLHLLLESKIIISILELSISNNNFAQYKQTLINYLIKFHNCNEGIEMSMWERVSLFVCVLLVDAKEIQSFLINSNFFYCKSEFMLDEYYYQDLATFNSLTNELMQHINN